MTYTWTHNSSNLQNTYLHLLDSILVLLLILWEKFKHSPTTTANVKPSINGTGAAVPVTTSWNESPKSNSCDFTRHYPKIRDYFAPQDWGIPMNISLSSVNLKGFPFFFLQHYQTVPKIKVKPCTKA